MRLAFEGRLRLMVERKNRVLKNERDLKTVWEISCEYPRKHQPTYDQKEG